MASDLGLYFLPVSHKKDAMLIWVRYMREEFTERSLFQFSERLGVVIDMMLIFIPENINDFITP